MLLFLLKVTVVSVSGIHVQWNLSFTATLLGGRLSFMANLDVIFSSRKLQIGLWFRCSPTDEMMVL